MRASANRNSSGAEYWWRTFFTSEIGKLLFSRPAGQNRQEVRAVIKATELKKGARVLDLCCGIGRHSVEFGKQGMDVTGLDYSQHYVTTAQDAVKRHGLDGRVRILRGDMRALTRYFKPGEFDLVVLLFNSFGYFRDRRDDHRVLSQISEILKPGGAMVIETHNVFKAANGAISKRPKFINSRAAGFGREPIGNFFVIDKSIFDRTRRQTYYGWTIIDARKSPAKIKRISYRQNIYSHAEFKNLLEPLGMQIAEVRETLLGGATFDPDRSWHQTFVAVKTDIGASGCCSSS